MNIQGWTIPLPVPEPPTQPHHSFTPTAEYPTPPAHHTVLVSFLEQNAVCLAQGAVTPKGANYINLDPHDLVLGDSVAVVNLMPRIRAATRVYYREGVRTYGRHCFLQLFFEA